MKNFIFILSIIALSGCGTGSATQETDSNKKVVDQVFDVSKDREVSTPEEREVVTPPEYSIEELLDLEIPGKDFTIGRVLADNEAYTRHYMTYISDGLKISGIINIPKPTVDDKGPWPVLFLNHGYIDPVVYTNGRGLKREQDYFARVGYVVIHSDYRGHAQSDINPVGDDKLGESGYTRDILGGINAFKSLNPDFAHVNQIGLLGHSMGGGVTMKAMVARPDQIQAAVLYAPVSSDYRDNLQRWMLDRISPQEINKIQNAGGQLDAELSAPYSVMTYFDRTETPVMIHHGSKDADVPLQWSKDTLNRLTAAGREVTYHEYPGEGHEFGVQWTQFMQRSVEFYDRHLKQ